MSPDTQLLGLVGFMAGVIILLARRLFYWKARALDQERATKYWFGRTG